MKRSRSKALSKHAPVDAADAFNASPNQAAPADLADGAAFVARLHEIYGHLAPQVLDSLHYPDEGICFWSNPLLSGIEIPAGESLSSLPQLRFNPDREVVTHSQAALDGAIYAQNPSSFFATQVLGPQAGEEVLDLAAAPGGKTIAMAVAMQNQGRIAAVEPIAGRFHRLRANVTRCGVTMVDFYQKDGRGIGRLVPERFDRVLLDAPCSSEARMRWARPQSYAHWSLRKVKETSRKQRSLIRSAYAALKPGGVMVYCTCSFSPEENELVVQHLLKRTDALLEDIDTAGLDSSATCDGITEWAGKTLHESLSRSQRILPATPWDGFFLTKIRKPARQ